MVPFDPCEPKITLHHENPTKEDLRKAARSSDRLTVFDSPVILDSSIARE
jgi:hypothetical protein